MLNLIGSFAASPSFDGPGEFEWHHPMLNMLMVAFFLAFSVGFTLLCLGRFRVGASVLAIGTIVFFVGGTSLGSQKATADDDHAAMVVAHTQDVTDWLNAEHGLNVTPEATQRLLHGDSVSVTRAGTDVLVTLERNDGGGITVYGTDTITPLEPRP